MTAAAAPWCPSSTTAPAHVRLVRPRHLAVVPRKHVVASVRLSRRGRLTVTLLVSAAVVLVALAVMPASGLSAGIDHTMTVQRGQTLSEIAATQLPDLPLQLAVAQIQIANDLNSAQVQAGQILQIPTVP